MAAWDPITLPLAGMLLLAAQDPEPPGAPAAPAQPTAVELGRELCRQLAAAPLAHLVADAILLSPDPERPEIVHRWRLEIDTWLAKGGRSRSVLRWSDAGAGAQAPRKVLVTLSDGERIFTWVEGEASYRTRPAPERFVPYPLPELFAAFEGGAQGQVPTMADAKGFVWSEELGSLPTVVSVSEDEEPAPVTWISFRPEGELAGYCTLFPEESGGETLRAIVLALERPERLPEAFAGFAPPEGMHEQAPEPQPEKRQD